MLCLSAPLVDQKSARAADPPAGQCTAPKTTCTGDGGYYASAEDLARVTAVGDPLLKELRACLDSVGGKHITPTFAIRWDSEGNAVAVKIDVPGYESQACVTKIQAKLQTLQNPHETSIRCEYGCSKPAAPAPPPPVPPPVVVPAPVTTTTAPPPPAPPPPVKKEADWHTEKVWYGYQTLTADAISVALVVAGGASQSGGLAGAGYGAFVLGTPIVHMVHGNVGPGFGSFALRLLAPWLGFGIGAIVGLIVGGSSGQGFDKVGNGASGAVYGAIAGFTITCAGIIAIDAAALAYTKERVDGPPPKSSYRMPNPRSFYELGVGSRPVDDAFEENRRTEPHVQIAPTLVLDKDRAGLGVVGRF